MPLCCEDSQILVLVRNSIAVSVVREHEVDVCVLMRNNMVRKGKDLLVHDNLGHNYFSIFDSKRGKVQKAIGFELA